MVNRSRGNEAKWIGQKYQPTPEQYTSSWSLPKELMQAFPQCPVFIETGTFVGGGVTQAMECHFEKIYSIEVDQSLYDHNKNRFPSDGRVNLYLGDTVNILPGIMGQVKDRALIFLDAHWWGETVPVLRELEIIGTHPIKDHVILIDDIYLLEKDILGPPVSIPSIVTGLLKINPNYSIYYKDSKVKGEKILVAEVTNG